MSWQHQLAASCTLTTLLLAAAAVSVAQQQQQVQGSGVMKTETRQVDAFTRIEIRGGATIDASIGKEQSLTVEAEDNILPLIDTTVKNGTLVVGNSTSYSSDKGVKLHIVVPSLQGLKITGAGEVNITGLKEPKFMLDLRGAGNVKMDGSTDELTITLAGSGDVDTTKLAAKRAVVNLRGSGDVKVHAEESLQAHLAGNGDVRYTGNPAEVLEHITGNGSVKPL
jgi:hypothetical protein